MGAAALAAPLTEALDTASVVLLFLLAVVLAAARFGRGPALLAAGASVFLLNVVFVPPRYSLDVADERFFFTFGVMLVVGLVVGQLTAGLRAQAQAARSREHRMASLYDISRELGGALTAEQVAQAVERFARAELGQEVTLWVLTNDGTLKLHGAQPIPEQEALARWVVLKGRAAAADEAEQPDAPWLVLPLRATMAVRGALGVRRTALSRTAAAEQRQLLSTCATLLASALERIHYVEVAQATALEIDGERLRNTLLAGLSHDLRTPLASLVGLAESLRLTRPPPTAQQAEIAEAMAASARRMAALTHNLLEMARLQSGTVALDRQWQPLEEVVGTAIAAVTPALAGRGLKVSLAEGLPWVRLDAVQMERVLVNLLENAAKFTPEAATVEITARSDVAGPAPAIELAVEDDGPGLPAGREEALFKKFERGHPESAMTGVGLGLAICRAIVLAHGGSIHAEARDGGGARFVIRLPAGTPPLPPPGEDCDRAASA